MRQCSHASQYLCNYFLHLSSIKELASLYSDDSFHYITFTLCVSVHTLHSIYVNTFYMLLFCKEELYIYLFEDLVVLTFEVSLFYIFFLALCAICLNSEFLLLFIFRDLDIHSEYGKKSPKKL